jgi:hypothetical protein
MIEYSAYFITEAGTVAGVQSVYSANDDDALKTARQLLLKTRFSSVEVWDHLSRVGSVDLE